MSGAQNSPTPPPLFDRNRIARRLKRAWTGSPDFVTQLVLNDLADRLAITKRHFTKAAFLAPDIRVFPDELRSAEGPITFEKFSTLVSVEHDALDPENLQFPTADYELIVSLLDLQVINDVPGFLTQLRRHLKPDGLLLAAALGGQSLAELRAAWLRADAIQFGGAYARIAPFIDVRDAGTLLQRTGFALPVADKESHIVRYADPLALMGELRAIGASNPMHEAIPHWVTRNLLGAAIDAYPRDEDDRISATLEIVWMSGWAPHESQQKPLAPGSAKVSLAQVLGKRRVG